MDLFCYSRICYRLLASKEKSQLRLAFLQLYYFYDVVLARLQLAPIFVDFSQLPELSGYKGGITAITMRRRRRSCC